MAVQPLHICDPTTPATQDLTYPRWQRAGTQAPVLSATPLIPKSSDRGTPPSVPALGLWMPVHALLLSIHEGINEGHDGGDHVAERVRQVAPIDPKARSKGAIGRLARRRKGPDHP